MRILNLGAGVQSTAVFLMAREGLIPPIEYAIFADTQDEPKDVYTHLEWLKRVPAPVPQLMIRSVGCLGDHLKKGVNSTGGRFASIPAHTAPDHKTHPNRNGCNRGIIRRQCTREYKIEVVERAIKRELLGIKPKCRVPKGTVVTQIFGISWDERKRADRISARIDKVYWSTPEFPLIEKRMTRFDCHDWLKSRVPHEVPRSACVY